MIMVFPQTVRDTTVELYVNNNWVEVAKAGDVRGSGNITVVRGASDESSTPRPVSCNLVLDNTLGNYSPRNPLGIYYSSIGEDTPMRIGIVGVRDTFTRTVASGWGTSDTGYAWTTGTGFASAVGSGVGTHTVTSTSNYQYTYLGSFLARDIDVVATVSLSFTNVTGGDLEPCNIILRGQSSTDYYMVRLVINSSEAVTIGLFHFSGQIAAPVATGIVHSSGQSLRVRGSIEGSTIRAKVWPASSSEPYGWNVTAYDNRITAPGWVGIRSGVAGGNTNIPVTFSYDNIVVTRPRFYGFISSLAPQWDVSGNDMISVVDAGGTIRRLGQGAPILGSPLKRGMLLMSNLVAYWPCEDGIDSTQLSSVVSGGSAMSIGVDTQFASNSDFIASDPIAIVGDNNFDVGWVGAIPFHTVVDRTQVWFLMSIPATGTGGGLDLVTVFTTGTIARTTIQVDSSGNMRMDVRDASGTQVYLSGWIGFAVNGKPVIVSVELWQSGSDVVANLVTLEPGASVGLQIGTHTITGQTVGRSTIIQFTGAGQMAIGHISVHNQWVSLFALSDQLKAYVGELALTRMIRLCGEENVPFTLTGDITDTFAMGAQQSGTLLSLLNDCTKADLGILGESRGAEGIWYRTRTSLYSQSVTASMDYSTGEIAPPLLPVDDDRFTINYVTVKRTNGGQAIATLSTGRLSTLPPGSGGVGKYEYGAEVNLADDGLLSDIAYWILHVGTVDESRYPGITINLANLNVVASGKEPAVLDLDAGYRLQVINPKALQSPDTIDQLTTGYTEVIGAFLHSITFNCRPASPFDVAVVDSQVYALDSDTTTLTNLINSSANSFQVTVTDSGLWSLSSADWPIDIMVGGERMSVGSVSGSSSPQTFSSVTRSVNGVVIGHAAGTAVRVTHPVVLGL